MATISFSSTGSGKKSHPKEADVQKLCWDWLAYQKVGSRSLQDYCYMVPNGTQLGGSRKRRGQYMASLKAQGFRPGVSDIVIAYPTMDVDMGGDISGHHGAYIELKRDRESYGGPAAVASAVRKEQLEWLRLMYTAGYFVYVAYGFDDFKRGVEIYLAGETPPELESILDLEA